MKSFNTLVLATLLQCTMSLTFAETKLTYPQRQAVQRQQSTLKEVEKKVASGAQESEKKYLIQKLDNVIADLDKNKCPDDNEQIADIKNRVTAAREKLGTSAAATPEEKAVAEKKDTPEREGTKEETTTKTDGKLEEKKVTEKEEEQKTVSPIIKLTYPQRQAVDRQTRNLKELEEDIAKILEKEPSIKYYPAKVEAGLGYNKKIDGILSDLEKANCPKENDQIADIYNRIEKAKKTLSELEVKLKPKFELYDKYTNIANYPNYANDMDQLKRLFKKYNNSETFYTNKEKADDLINGYKDDALFFNALYTTYKPIIAFKTAQGNALYDKMLSIKKHMESFLDAKKTYGETLPKEIESQLSSAKTMAKDAFDNKKPAFFGGGVLQKMDKAKADLEMLVAILGPEDAKVKALSESYEKQKSEIAGMEKSMEELILAEERLPEEAYSGSDKESLRTMVLNAWKKEYPNDEIIKLIMHKDGWNRTNKWTYNAAATAWQQSDKSVFVCLVVVKTDGKIATTYPAFANKDHLNNDKIKMGVQTKGSGYVQRRVLIANIK